MKVLDGETVSISEGASEPFDCYLVGSSPNWVVIIYDIFGMHPNKYEMADWLAQNKGLAVAVPDVRRGHNWPMHLYPPPPEHKEAFYKYLENDANPKLRAVETKQCIDYVTKNRGARSIGLLGLCWGAKVASLIDNYGNVKCAVGAHPSFLKSEDGEKTTIPTLMLPCAEDNLTVYLSGALRNKNPRLFTVSEDYIGTFHGFLGARGQWTRPEEKTFVDRAKEEIPEFIHRHVTAHESKMESHCCAKTGLPPTATICNN